MPHGRATALADLLAAARGCTLCAAHLPHGARPVLRLQGSARLLIVSQAPGARVHESGIPWQDASGDRLRDWLGLAPERFYDAGRVAIMPMGFCYPGRAPRGGDRPPRPECAPLWHPRLLPHLPALRLTLLVGAHAQRRYWPGAAGQAMTETVRGFRAAPTGLLPLPHPSWRSTLWMRRNLWFEAELLPVLRGAVEAALAG
ncbi:MAG: uracil-DNA glycosylase family protein [Dongiaceae bacterium]